MLQKNFKVQDVNIFKRETDKVLMFTNINSRRKLSCSNNKKKEKSYIRYFFLLCWFMLYNSLFPSALESKSNFSCYISIKPSSMFITQKKLNVLWWNLENAQIVLPKEKTQARSENSIAKWVWNTYGFSR